MATYTTGEIAKHYNKSVSTIIRLIENNKIDYKRDNKNKRILTEVGFQKIGELLGRATGAERSGDQQQLLDMLRDLQEKYDILANRVATIMENEQKLRLGDKTFLLTGKQNKI
jgi:hypothetical protein